MLKELFLTMMMLSSSLLELALNDVVLKLQIEFFKTKCSANYLS